MAATTKTPAPLTVSPEVLDDARRRGLDQCMSQLVEVAQRVFAEAKSITVDVELDPEIADLSWIVFTVEGPFAAFEQQRRLRQQWYDETAAVCPKHLLGELALNVWSR